jgi:uncharacterized protein (DUF362 family)
MARNGGDKKKEKDQMTLDPRVENPLAVVVGKIPVSTEPTDQEFKQAARQMMTALGIKFEGEGVVFKPNVTIGERFKDPGSGITTHPAFVHALIDSSLGAGAGKTYILEDPLNCDNNKRRRWRGTGYREVAASTGAKLRCPKTYTCIEKMVPNPNVHSTLKVSRLAVDPRVVLINVPKLKTHNLAATTLSMKNLMGAVNAADRHYCRQAWEAIPEEKRSADRERSEGADRTLHEQWQRGLADRLADTSKVIRPRLNIVEGVVGRDGTGFQRGENYPMGLVVAGVNVVAVDSVASYLMGFDPGSLIYLQVVQKAGLGETDIGKLTIYTAEDGQLSPCANLEEWRAVPRFNLITKLPGEPEPKG